jgi:cupin fold WbuC family metalloprotein
MKTVSDKLLNELHSKAKESPRKRTHHLFHQFEDPVQRMVNAMEPGSYIPPHKHQNPDKIEAFIILRGRAACLKFNDDGSVSEVHIIDESGPEYAVDIPPGTWHTFVSLKSGTALFEVIQGPYEPGNHKNLAPWAPSEEEGAEYLKHLEDQVAKWENR